MAQVTVIILTIGRPHLLNHAFTGLCSQVFKDFDVLLVLKKHDSETIAVSNKFKKFLNISIKIQESDSFISAYNEGIHNTTADIIAFLDDDAFPEPTWLSEHISSHKLLGVSGVSGEVVPAQVINNKFQVKGESEVAQFYDEPKSRKAVGNIFWNRPLDGQENFLAYISKAGYSQKVVGMINGKRVNSLLCMAANMSVRKEALKDFVIPTSFIKRGIAFEQVVGWHLLRTGHRLIFNPHAKVYHIIHGQTMSRFLDTKSILEAYAEDELLFYYLFSEERQLSIMHRIISLGFRIMVHIRKIEQDWRRERYVFKGILMGNLIGAAWLISKKTGGSFVPIHHSFFEDI